MKVLKNLDLKNILFIDIETVRLHQQLDIDSPMFDAWAYSKRKKNETDQELQQLYEDKAALEAEFAKIVCITMGMIVQNKLMVMSFYNEDEATLLEEFVDALTRTRASNHKVVLCGHAIIGFDVPFIFKRCMVNRVEPNGILDTAGEKPWTVDKTLIDTKDLWKGTGFFPSSLIAVAVCLGLPHSKDDISGKDVGRVYYSEGREGLLRIVRYCEKDVLTVANIVRVIRGEEIIDIEHSKVDLEDQPLLQELNSGASFTKARKAKLTGLMSELSTEEIPEALLVLSAMAENKESKVTKTFVKQLKDEYTTAEAN